MKQTKILQLCAHQPPGFGGIERVACELSRFFNDNLIANQIYYLYRSKCFLEVALDESPSFAVESFCLMDLNRLIVCLRSLFLPFGSIRVVPVFHFPSIPFFCLWLLRSLLFPKALQYVYWHSPVVGRSPIGKIASLVYSHLVRHVASNSSSQFIVTSPDVANDLRHLCSSSLIVVLPPVLSSEAEIALVSNRRLLSRPPGPLSSLKVLTIGRLASYKCPDKLLEILPSHEALSFMLVGDGPKKHSLMKTAERLGVGNRVFFAGRVSEEQKRYYLYQSDIHILLSDSPHEAFGIVQLEAMAAGVPCIAFDIPRSGVSWVSSSCDVLPFASITPVSLPKVIQIILGHGEILKSLSMHSADRYDRLFSRAAWFSSACGVFQSIIPACGIAR